MKSLRTDDIMGARPRIRHAPRVLVRDSSKDRYIDRQSPEHNYRLPNQIYKEKPSYQKYSSHPQISMSSELERKQPNQSSPIKIQSKQMPHVKYTLPTNNEQPKLNNPEKNIKIDQSPIQKQEEQRIYSRRSNKSGQKLTEQKKQKANIFRGLGYNIITNHKFSYDMENSIKNQTSSWLKY